jgi:thiamine-phosphate pyrophosphorylase
MELIVISNPVAVADENIIINNLFQAGLKSFHIRKPESDIQSVKELLNGIAPCFYERIALHQFHEMANDFGIHRLHYTESARIQSSPQQWKLQVEKGFILSTSIHDTTLLPELNHFEYAFYGPVFDSISKPGYQSKLSADFKLDKTNRSKPKVIALGGVELSNLLNIKQMGFDGAAVLGTLWNESDKALKRFHQLKENLHI